MKKTIKNVLLGFILLAIATACTTNNEIEATNQDKAETSIEKENILIGTNASHLETVEKAVEILNNKSDKYTYEIKIYDDYQTPNLALDEGKINLNFYQHKPFLDQFNEENGTNLVPVNNEGVYSLQYGIYSKKYDSIEDIPEGATVVVMNDPVNRDIQLRLLEEQGLIKLEKVNHYKGLPDIIENKKNLNIIEMDGSRISDTLEDPQVDVTVAMGYGIARVGGDAKSAIAFSSPELTGEMVSCLVSKEEDQDADWAIEFFDELRSPELEAFYNDRFQGMIKILK